MADPVTIGVLAATGMGATAVGGGIKAIGQIFTGRAQANLANYQAAVSDMNAKIKKQDANYTRAASEVEAEEVGLKTQDQIARTKEAFAAGNISLTSATPSRVIGSELAIGQQTEGIVRANAAKRAYGFQVGAAEDIAQAGVYRMSAKYDRTAAMVGAASTVLGTVGQLSGDYISAKAAGMFNG